MKKQQKTALVSDLQGLMGSAQATFLINYKGLSVAKLQSLRRTVRNDGGSVKVTKASLMRIAAQNVPGSDVFATHFKDQVGLVFANSDVSAVAKQLVKFAKDHTALKVIAGFYEARMISSQELMFLATLPSKEVLLGQLAATLQAPVAGLARVLNAHIASLAYALKAVEQQKQGNE
jgi:large subunit ribosomal protein L10